MGSESEHQRPGQVFARRVKEARKRRGWSQQQLAKRVSEDLGHPMSRVTVTKIEKGAERAENASISDVLALAAALEIPPVYLLAPREDEQAVAVTPKLELPAPEARAWIRGRPLPGGDFTAFFAELPTAEQESLMRQYLERGLSPLGRALMADKTNERTEDLVWELTEGERIRQRERKEDNDAES